MQLIHLITILQPIYKIHNLVIRRGLTKWGTGPPAGAAGGAAPAAGPKIEPGEVGATGAEVGTGLPNASRGTCTRSAWARPLAAEARASAPKSWEYPRGPGGGGRPRAAAAAAYGLHDELPNACSIGSFRGSFTPLLLWKF